MKRRLLISLLSAAILWMLFGCSQPIKGVGSATGRLSGLEPADQVSAGYLEGYHAFSASLLRNLYAKDTNVFVSPASLYIALGMTADGTDHNTLAQIQNAMGVSDADALNTGCRDLQSLLTGNPEKYFKLSNAVWFDESCRDIIRPDFLARNENYFGALIAAVPFDDTLIPAINKWASKNTDGMIKKVLEPPLDPDVFMYLTNALLFDGKWEMKFKKSGTKNGTFHGAKGDLTIPMMNRSDKENATWYEDGAVQATLLDYQDKRTAMMIVLPKENLDGVMAGMTADTLSGWIGGIKECGGLTLTLPRFSLTYKRELTGTLQSMGITDAFDADTADFSRLLETDKAKGPVYIGTVIHQTALEVDENGTRAAAVSLFGIVSKSSASADEHTMIVDRPFFCAIIDKPTGAVLFAGTVSDPKKMG